MRKPVIAIDGFSSTGKSSISKIIAKRLGIIHLDTGALYRAVTLFALEHHRAENGINFPELFADLPKNDFRFLPNFDLELCVAINGEDVSEQIRDPEVNRFVSIVARQPEVRAFLLSIQREAAASEGAVLDGRDIGTVVLPNADYKFFLTANMTERTKRRYLELQKSGKNVTMEEVRENLEIRDKIDSEREIAPLKMADDAILIDNSELNKQQTIELILSYINNFKIHRE